MERNKNFDVIIIGGGFYGCCMALLMKKYCDRILIIEKESDLLLRASRINQARVHNGYHYPRNIITAYRSFINFPRFVLDFKNSIMDDFVKIYAIARNLSKVNAYQFTEMYKKIGAPLKKAPLEYQQLFNMDYIEEVFLVKEVAFDAESLKNNLKQRLEKEGIAVWYNVEVEKVEHVDNDNVKVVLVNDDSNLIAQKVFNCSYSQINKILKNSEIELLPFKHEVTEMALIEMPEELKYIGITVMDGPFFSTMPYPARNLHSLSHVRYTPHYSWNDLDNFMDGHALLKNSKLESNFSYMLKDAQRYLPLISKARYVDSLFEIKTVLLQSEIDDGRPILFRKDHGIKNFSTIMGGKIDNVYDVLEMIGEAKEYGKIKSLTSPLCHNSCHRAPNEV